MSTPPDRCGCALVADLALNSQSLIERGTHYKTMRAPLKQLAHRVVERGWEEYRLYSCPECAQAWQASRLMVGIEENFYLYKVPFITKKAWLAQPYICPSLIVRFMHSMDQFFEQPFQSGTTSCIEAHCSQTAIMFSKYCQNHHIQSLFEARCLINPPSGRLFGPYTAPWTWV